MILGITGIFGSGKTSVAELFAKHGFLHINADEIGHRLIERKDVRDNIIRLFGKDILDDGKIDRGRLKKIVFSDARKLTKLNSLLHPAILREIKNKIKANAGRDVAVDAPLLIEADGTKLVDKVVVVKITKKEQLRRLLAKGKWTKKEISQISRSQMPQGERLKYADFVVDNSSSLQDTGEAVKNVLGKIPSC
ncbi:dephospho-CoA kinase [Candidatus Woesearchaeota archaeon]|nr:dephospho-CoA kinase [Candidatus Woesearchaeota archaeon]